MAITKFTQHKDDSFDDIQRLMCSVHGCQKRWSVHMEGEKPKCSKHAWQKEVYKAPDLKEVFKNSRPVKHWQDDEEAF
jgi:hypothetical protein